MGWEGLCPTEVWSGQVWGPRKFSKMMFVQMRFWAYFYVYVNVGQFKVPVCNIIHGYHCKVQNRGYPTTTGHPLVKSWSVQTLVNPQDCRQRPQCTSTCYSYSVQFLPYYLAETNTIFGLLVGPNRLRTQYLVQAYQRSYQSG